MWFRLESMFDVYAFGGDDWLEYIKVDERMDDAGEEVWIVLQLLLFR